MLADDARMRTIHPSRRVFLKTSALAAPFLFLPRLRAAEPWEANEVIQKHRRSALAVLKPTKAQLDRGLKLHAESLVFDTYGFAPRCAVDGATLAKLAAENASALELKREAIRGGMLTLRRSALNKLLEGTTTLSEVYRVSTADNV